MKIIISGIHFKENPKLKIYAEQKIQKLIKYDRQIYKVEARLISKKSHRGQEKDFSCELRVFIPGKTLEVVDAERAMDKAIDKAMERMKVTLTRHKEKHISRDHKRGILNKLIARFRT